MFDIFSLDSTPFFAFGQQPKTSLIAQFCRQSKYQHIKNPILEAIKNRTDSNCVIEGSTQLFWALEPLRPEMQVVFVGTKFTQEQIRIRRDYRKIGKCIEVRQFNYEKFRKAMNPNLIFFYGPVEQQNLNCAHALANQIGYSRVYLPPNANSFIKDFKKTLNYAVSGLFTDKKQLMVLEQLFNIKVIHLQYNRIDLPEKAQYFDTEFQMLSYLKGKDYYHAISGFNDDVKVIDQVSEVLSPELVYCALDDASKRQYLDQYIERNESTTLILSTFQIQSINKRKNIPLAQTPYHRTNLLNQILYRDFSIKQALIFDYPFHLNEVLNFESANRKFTKFIDLVSPSNAMFFKEFITPMYFLQNQLRIVPNMNKPLQSYLNAGVNYWLVNGSQGSGKTTVAKFLQTEYGFKLIEYEPYFAGVKEKLLAPEDGEEVPLKKVIAHFNALFNANLNDTYVIDGLPFDNKDLQEWINQIGTPSVINLQVPQVEAIKRSRKKNEADVNAQIPEQQLAKAKESAAKAQAWLQKVRTFSDVVQVHELNFGAPLILSQKLIHKILKKNVYLVQIHNSLTFQNVALKYNLALVNLHLHPLRESLGMIRKIQNKDLILCFYRQNDEQLISEDLYWIQKNIGNIRYLAVFEPQPVEVNEEKIPLEKPKAPQKPKVQGAEGQQKPPEEEPAEKKDAFDIYAYEWSKPQNPKNLSQWFLKSKKNVTKVQSSSPKQVFQNWKKLTSAISSSQEAAVYHTFK